MDISYENMPTKQCFKCNEEALINLNVFYYAPSDTIILWNQYQIFVYVNKKFEKPVIKFNSRYEILDIMICDIYLACVDNCGEIQLHCLNTNSKIYFSMGRGSSNYIVAVSLIKNNMALCLKYNSNTYSICLNQIAKYFEFENQVQLLCNDALPPLQTPDRYIIVHGSLQSITDDHLETLQNTFCINEYQKISKNHKLVVLSFDKLDAYSCIIMCEKSQCEAKLVKLYSCPSEISNINIIEPELTVVITLAIGTVVILSWTDLKTPKIVHLNIAVHKSLVYKGSIIYTDGKTLWRADNIMSQDIKFRQFFVKQVKDFVIVGNEIICTTFTNLIYTFSIDSPESYLKDESIEYCPADRLLNNHSDYVKKILDEVNKNDVIAKKLMKERDYITALSLSNRQDVMDSVINHKVIVYDNYDDAIMENKKAILTSNFSEYFEEESFFILVKIATTTEHKLDHILSNATGDLRIHLTVSTSTKVIKTISIKVAEIKKLSYLIPLKSKAIDFTEMNVNIKIMSTIPGALDAKHKTFTILYRKQVTLHSEHFIKFNLILNRRQCLKRFEDPLAKLILQSSINNFGHLFEFEDGIKHRPSKEWQMYVRLPDKYQEVFRNKENTKHLTSKKVTYFLQQFTSEEFLKSKSNLIFSIGNEKVKIEIYNDSFSNPLLKLSSANIKILSNMRNFLSDLIYCVFTNFAPGNEFINLSSYATIENLQKAVRTCIAASSEDLEPLIEQFERNVIGVLPI
ncbi:unnamed protein product [Spodoptera littoralis]|uniref:Uncharacterized protein n=1 Tax=Spodoptera littoralis TaxID=7109 RepID=A0A9P0I5N9_SPOLI|nr:unnamed protein product [Spodoptera littoralis]CAH1640639.1 unnamed protein product [Spodoptera littoralis]